MKKLLLLISLSLVLWSKGSFYDLYAQNRANNRPNLITADFITSAYANYKLSRESEVELKILKPRVLNFANYLYQGVVEINQPKKGKAIAYGAVFAILAKGGRGLIIPDGYEYLKDKIVKEARLITEAKKITTSPLSGKKTDYRLFAIPPKYKNHPAYYRTIKFAQTMPMPKQITQTINASERLTNLYRHINKILEQFVGLSHNPKVLFAPKDTLDNLIFRASAKPSINDIAKAIYPKNPNIKSALTKIPKKLQQLHQEVKEHILHLHSSYDYDWKIMQTLIQAGYINAFKGYYTQTKYRTRLFTKRFRQKRVQTKRVNLRTKASIEPKLVQTLSTMIEGALLFSTTIKNNSVDLEMVEVLKELRRIVQTKRLTPKDIDFLNTLDLNFLNIVGVQDRPLSVWVAHGLVEELREPKGFRYLHIERGIK